MLNQGKHGGVELEGQNSSAFSFNKGHRGDSKQYFQIKDSSMVQSSPKAHHHMRSKSKQDVQFNLFKQEQDRISNNTKNINNSGISLRQNDFILNQLKKSKHFKDNLTYSQYSKSGGNHERMKPNQKLHT